MEGYVPGEQPQDRRYIKLNTNENPYPPSPRVIEALRAAVTDDLRLYPDPEARALRDKAAEIYGVPVEQILAGNGSDDLCRCSSAPAPMPERPPTWRMRPLRTASTTRSPRSKGRAPKTVPYACRFRAPRRSAPRVNGARLTIICNPNSPSGTVTPLATIDAFAKRAAGLVVVDEAYVDFARERLCRSWARCPNVVVLRTFSKSFSLAGMRIGLAFGSPEIIARTPQGQRLVQPRPLEHRRRARRAGRLPWMQANTAKICEARELLQPALRELGLDVLSSQTNFIFARSPRSTPQSSTKG